MNINFVIIIIIILIMILMLRHGSSSPMDTALRNWWFDTTQSSTFTAYKFTKQRGGKIQITMKPELGAQTVYNGTYTMPTSVDMIINCDVLGFPWKLTYMNKLYMALEKNNGLFKVILTSKMN
jgi:hypothetical protein